MDKIEIIESLQVSWSLNWLNVNEFVNSNVVSTLVDFYDVIYDANNDSLSISPFDYYQLSNGILIKKQTKSEYVNEKREGIYDYLCDLYWDIIIDGFLLMLNKSTTLTNFDNFILITNDILILEKIYALSIIELELIWKSYLSEVLVNLIIENWISLDSAKLLWEFYYSNWDYESAFKFLNILINTDYLNSDKDLLTKFIWLNKTINNNEWVEELLSSFTLLLEKSEKWVDNDKELKNDLNFIYSNYIDYLLVSRKNLDKLEKNSIISINLWNKDANFHLIYSLLQKKDYINASEYYNKWITKSTDTEIVFSEDNLSEIEKFYILWIESWIDWALEIMVDFYREQFIKNGYNSEYFYNFVDIVSDSEYIFIENDKIFFDLFNDKFQDLDNDKNILELIDVLFLKYSDKAFALFLEKILLIISKNFHNKYDKHLEIKRRFTSWFENLAIIDKFNSEWIHDLDLFAKTVKEKVLLLSDIDYLNARFDELLLIFCTYNLSIIERFSKQLNIPIYLASIFEHYWFTEEMNMALKHDEFFEN